MVIVSSYTHTHGFTVQGQDADREGSASSVSRPEHAAVLGGRASVSTPRQSTTDSPSLEKPQPTSAAPATPASEQGSSSPVHSSGAEPAQGAAETVADDVFSTADDVFSASDSPQKEFHCAVLRALSKESSLVEAAKADQAPGTLDEAASQLNSGLLLHPSPARSWSASTHSTLGVWESLPAVSSPFYGNWSPLVFFLPIASTLLYPQFDLLSLLLDYFPPNPSL